MIAGVVLRYMANVSKFFRNYFILLVLLLYVLFSMWEYDSRSDEGREKNVNILKHIGAREENIDSVIVGGSNALFSLSARQLSLLTEAPWINFSLVNEGYSDENYTNFLLDALDEKTRSGVSRVVYSSITPFRKGRPKKRESNSLDVSGGRFFNFVPNRSLASFIKSWLTSGEENVNEYNIDARFGDFEFGDFECRSNGVASVNTAFQRESMVPIAEWAEKRIKTLLWLFPKAEIYMVLPSEFYGAKFLPSEAAKFANKLREVADRLGDESDRRIVVVEQPPFNSYHYVCDKAHHANESGREWRTENLAKSIFFVPE